MIGTTTWIASDSAGTTKAAILPITYIATLSMKAAGAVPGYLACMAVGNGVNEMNSSNRPFSRVRQRATAPHRRLAHWAG
jgi:hypothetical protein